MNVLSLLTSFLLFLTSCSSDERSQQDTTVTDTINLEASIVSVSAAGDAGSYTFSVGIESPDTGCSQYANWWEVITEDGTLVYRRILGHSHVDEQPFVRSGGSVAITENQVVIIRAHMNSSGYGTSVLKGSVSNGFTEDTLASSFASELTTQSPLPSSCAF